MAITLQMPEKTDKRVMWWLGGVKLAAAIALTIRRGVAYDESAESEGFLF